MLFLIGIISELQPVHQTWRKASMWALGTYALTHMHVYMHVYEITRMFASQEKQAKTFRSHALECVSFSFVVLGMYIHMYIYYGKHTYVFVLICMYTYVYICICSYCSP